MLIGYDLMMETTVKDANMKEGILHIVKGWILFLFDSYTESSFSAIQIF